METFSAGEKTFEVDDEGFLVESSQWERSFAEGMSERLRISGGLRERHWLIINYIRQTYQETGRCPGVYETTSANLMSLQDLQALFPTGYLRGACKLAGITYREGYLPVSWAHRPEGSQSQPETPGKVYRVDVRGFLVDPSEWDETFASCKAYEMKLPGGLTEGHWRVLRFLRQRFEQSGAVPTVGDCCQGLGLLLADLAALFPDGYHRGAVKLAGLRAR